MNGTNQPFHSAGYLIDLLRRKTGHFLGLWLGRVFRFLRFIIFKIAFIGIGVGIVVVKRQRCIVSSVV